LSVGVDRPPAGTLKVVLATNVAETSITIDDVSFVIDTGRAKEMSHDAERSILRLQEGYVSKAAAQQRRGRAGRVRWEYQAQGFSSLIIGFLLHSQCVALVFLGRHL
jgi:HrpA-like RNA helicase